MCFSLGPTQVSTRFKVFYVWDIIPSCVFLNHFGLKHEKRSQGHQGQSPSQACTIKHTHYYLDFTLIYFFQIILDTINFVKSKYKTQTLKVKPKIKCNTFWRCIFYAHVMKLLKLPPPP